MKVSVHILDSAALCAEGVCDHPAREVRRIILRKLPVFWLIFLMGPIRFCATRPP